MNPNARGPAIVTFVFAFLVFEIANLAVTVPPVIFFYRTMAMIVRMFI